MILDAYAIRTGAGSWATPITREALDEVRGALRRTATRQTAVACFVNDGRIRMRLAWVVGSRKAFTSYGAVPVGTKTVHRREPPAAWLRLVALMARAAGLAHDIGKASVMFQRKLGDPLAPKRDAVRHEWLSMKVLQRLRTGQSWDEAWSFTGLGSTALREMPPFTRRDAGLKTSADVIDLAVVTHHGLLDPKDPGQLSGMPTVDGHVREPSEGFVSSDLQAKAALPEKLLATQTAIEARIRRLGEESQFTVGAWWPAFMLARAALIAADHLVSAREPSQANAALYANTIKGESGRFNQTLPWHLQNVGELGQDLAASMWTSFPGGLSMESVRSIEAAGAGRFTWQNGAAGHLERFARSHAGPVLVFNVAATGSGKTRMNMRALCVMARAQDKPARVSIALNLRSLTLQTGDAMRGQLGIGEDELAVVIGDRTVAMLFAASKVDENPPETVFDVVGQDFELPAWMDEWVQKHDRQRQLLGAPLLVSTIDYLIAAGEPHRQQHHVSAMLRVAGADLVLDEVDAYDAGALVAVLRLVQCAGLMGRNVVASSATLSVPVASAIASAFDSGVRQRAALLQTELAAGVSFIADTTDSISGPIREDFQSRYQAYAIRASRPPPTPVRLARLHAMPDGAALAAMGHRSKDDAARMAAKSHGEASWFAHVHAAATRLHADHAWCYLGAAAFISIGLIRVANIGHARRLACYLAGRAAEYGAGCSMRVACYHSQDFLIQRYLKEVTLDRLLTRKSGEFGNDGIEADEDIARWSAEAAERGLMLIVVATPVEEVGRDHDFDWAVIEPSSTQSVVQTAGRVNRHRLRTVLSPNICILEYNLRAWLGERWAFLRPGLEPADQPYESHSMASLLTWKLAENERRLSIGAALRFDQRHRFALLDDQSQTDQLRQPTAAIESAGCGVIDPIVLTVAWYRKYPLRGSEKRQAWRLNREGTFQQQRPGQFAKPEWFDSDNEICRLDAHPHAWLTWPTDVLREACQQRGVSELEGLSVQVRRPDETDPIYWHPSFGFGLD